MDQPPTVSPPPPRPDRARWTPARQRIFLTALLEFGCVSRAAQAAGMSRSSAHRLRTRLADTPFVRHWDAAIAEHGRRLADPFGRGLPPPPAPRSPPPPAPARAPVAARVQG